MGKTFNAAQRAARKGKKRQQRRKVAQQHVQEYRDIKYAPRSVAVATLARVERREQVNKQKHHTRKADRNYERETQRNTAENSQGAETR